MKVLLCVRSNSYCLRKLQRGALRSVVKDHGLGRRMRVAKEVTDGRLKRVYEKNE
jgi:hypothetical protein